MNRTELLSGDTVLIPETIPEIISQGQRLVADYSRLIFLSRTLLSLRPMTPPEQRKSIGIFYDSTRSLSGREWIERLMGNPTLSQIPFAQVQAEFLSHHLSNTVGGYGAFTVTDQGEFLGQHHLGASTKSKELLSGFYLTASIPDISDKRIISASVYFLELEPGNTAKYLASLPPDSQYSLFQSLSARIILGEWHFWRSHTPSAHHPTLSFISCWVKPDPLDSTNRLLTQSPVVFQIEDNLESFLGKERRIKMPVTTKEET